MMLEGEDLGGTMHAWARDLFPVCRSLTGDGVRQTLDYIDNLLPGLVRHEIPSGTDVLDWQVPDEWNIRGGWVADQEGSRLVDFADNNLHVVGYSEPIDRVVSRSELEPHLFSLPEQPEAVPYVTSYYRRTWGFCLSQRQRESLGAGPFHVSIDSDLKPGSMTYSDLVIEGQSQDEVLLSTYICHPSMANNELSGPVVTTALARWLLAEPGLRYTYRIVFAPETIGSIAYLAAHLEHLRKNVKAGWVVTCVGDERTYSYVPSRTGNTLADRISQQVLSEFPGGFDAYTYLDRGSDERQWCSPGADLPVCSIMRSKYGTYPEYHTSLDDLELVTPIGLHGGFEAIRRSIELLEANETYRTLLPGEPQLGRRGLYPTTSFKGSAHSVRDLMNVLAYCDGTNDVLDLCTLTGLTSGDVLMWLQKAENGGVIAAVR